MTMDAGSAMKARLRADLRRAMKDRRTTEAKVIRALVAAIDNAEAPPIHPDTSAPLLHRFQSGSAEVERLLLSGPDVRDLLVREVHEPERAADELEYLKMLDQAGALRAEAILAKRYIDPE